LRRGGVAACSPAKFSDDLLEGTGGAVEADAGQAGDDLRNGDQCRCHALQQGRIAPSAQRLLDRRSITPVRVDDAAWNLIMGNAPYGVLMGETSWWRGCTATASGAVWSATSRRPEPGRMGRVPGGAGR